MKLNLPTLKFEKTVAVQRDDKLFFKREGFTFEPIYVDLKKSKISKRIKELIISGKDIDKGYNGDESAALFAACIAMAGSNFTDQAIASVLTDKDYYLSSVSYRHAGNTPSRARAAKWVIEQNLIKARKHLAKGKIFEEPSDTASLTDGFNQERKFTFESFNEITFDPNTTALVEDLIGHNSLVLFYGDTNTGKTFATLDLALHIAQGKVWQNRKVEQGAVLYIATEGGVGMRQRIVALKKAFALEKKEIPFWLLSSSVNLSDPKADAEILIRNIKKLEADNNLKIRFLIIDTLNRAYGGDENSSADMNAFLKSIDLIQKKAELTVAIVHHSGKNAANGARGHSSLKAAVDTEIKIEADKSKKTLTASTTKLREYEYGSSMSFNFESIEIGKNSDGVPVTSCVLRPISSDEINVFTEKPFSTVSRRALLALNETTDISAEQVPKSFKWPDSAKVKCLDEWKSTFKNMFYKDKPRSSPSSAITKALKELKDANRIEIRENYVYVIEDKQDCTEMSDFE